MPKVHIKTFGCQMNEAESDALMSSIRSLPGVELTNSVFDCDFIICNACSVRRSAEERAEGWISQTSGMMKEGARIILTGCMADYREDELKKKFPYVWRFVSNNAKKRIPEIIAQSMKGDGSNDACDAGAKDNSYSFRECYYREGSVRSFIPIQNGCDNFCSYCVVPLVRGREVSRDFNQVLREIMHLDDSGVKIVTLLGQNVNSYKSGSKNFCDLVLAISRMEFRSIKWIYFESPHIKDFNPELLDIIASSKVFAKRLHVPIQSFSTSVLRAMNRKETEEGIHAFFDLARKRIPGVALTTDIMTGFPTETEEDFRLTLEGMRRVSFLDAFLYYYNPRKGTAAYSAYEDMDIIVKRERLEKLIALQGDISLELRKRMLGSVTEAVACSVSKKDSGKILCYTESDCALLADRASIKVGETGCFTLKRLSGRTFLV